MSGKKVAKLNPKQPVTKPNPKPPVTNNQGKKCDMCSTNVTARRNPGLSCFNCNKYFHAKCVSVSNVDLQILINTGANWPCPKCKPKISRRSNILPPPTNNESEINSSSTLNSSRASTSGQNVSVGLSNGRTLEEKVNLLVEEVEALKAVNTAFQTSFQFYSDTFDEYEPIFTECVSLTERIESLEKENDDLRKSLDSLHTKIADQEQEKNRNNLVITGIPEIESAEKSSLNLVADLAQNLAIEFPIRYITDCSRLRTQNAASSSKPSPILIKFNDTRSRDYFKKDIRNKKKQTKSIKFHGKTIYYYASDHLTHYHSQLFYAAQDFAKDHQYEFVWVNNGRIMLRKNRESDAVLIRSTQELINLH